MKKSENLLKKMLVVICIVSCLTTTLIGGNGYYITGDDYRIPELGLTLLNVSTSSKERALTYKLMAKENLSYEEAQRKAAGQRPALAKEITNEIKDNTSYNKIQFIPDSDAVLGFDFGEYPQKKLDENHNKDLIETLNILAGNESKWNSYNYCSSTNGAYGVSVSEYMKYCDVTYGGEKYRGVYFTSYRLSSTTLSSKYNQDTKREQNSLQDDNGYVVNTKYWFKYQKISWIPLSYDSNTDSYYIISEDILDSQSFNNYFLGSGQDSQGNVLYWSNSDRTNYANDFTTSDIRTWLNNDFYNTAFNETEKGHIKELSRSTGDTIEVSINGNEILDSNRSQIQPFKIVSTSTGINNSNDKITLLSANEAENYSLWYNDIIKADAYTFLKNKCNAHDKYNGRLLLHFNAGNNELHTYMSEIDKSDVLRNKIAVGTDYAKCQGLDDGYWRLRTSDNSYDWASIINPDGEIDKFDLLYRSNVTSFGIRPTLNISAKKINQLYKEQYPTTSFDEVETINTEKKGDSPKSSENVQIIFSSSQFNCTYDKNTIINLKSTIISTSIELSIIDNIEWSSSNSSVATVDKQTGEVKMLKEGTTTIIAYYECEDGTIISNSIVITVKYTFWQKLVNFFKFEWLFNLFK